MSKRAHFWSIFGMMDPFRLLLGLHSTLSPVSWFGTVASLNKLSIKYFQIVQFRLLRLKKKKKSTLNE